MNWLKLIIKSLFAGALIALAGIVFLGCQQFIADPNIAKVVGSCLFSIGLIAVIVLEANLYTGKIGYVNSGKLALQAGCILVFNLLIAILIGIIYKQVFPAADPFLSRLNKTWYRMLFDGVICGALIYLAVELYKKTKNLIPVILCVMAFILSGAEHCIADAFYLGVSGFSWEAVGLLGIAVVGNSIGSLAIRWLQIGAEKIYEVPNDIQR